MASADPKEDPACSVSLNVCGGPVPLTCDFCCVGGAPEESGIHTCPECSAEIQTHPELQSNGTETFCTYCTSSPVPAVKHCLDCDVHLCDKHLRMCSKAKEHVLSMEDITCAQRVLKDSCSGNANCICISCVLSEDHQAHQGEQMNMAAGKKAKLLHVLEHLTSKREETENRVQSLRERRIKVQERAADVTEKVTGLFTETRRHLDDLEKSVLADISRQEEQISLSVAGLIQQLEMEMSELSRRMRHVEELCTVSDPETVLQGWSSIIEGIVKAEGGWDKDCEVNARKDLDEGLISVTLHTGLSSIVTNVKRRFYVEQSPDMALNEDTASNDLYLSGDLKSASGSALTQNRPKTVDRFQHTQVLSTRNVSSGHHYWELETCDTGNWRVGLCYPSIARKGYLSLIGHSAKSWGLCRYYNLYFVIHDRKVIPVPHKPSSQRFGIYLDYEAGSITFYEVCDTIRHLHTYRSTFTEPLHVVLSVYTGWIKISS